MKTGRTLMDLAAEVQARAAEKEDFVAPAAALSISDDALLIVGGAGFPLQPRAHAQLAQYADIPKAYYDRLLGAQPEALAYNVNLWMRRKPQSDRRMIRTLRGEARAFLSNAYKRLDHEQMLEAALPALGEVPGLEVRSCEITDERLYLKVVSHKLTAEVKVGEPVRFGVAFGNSEVGAGPFWVKLFAEVLRCTNGLVVDEGLRKVHIGRRVLPESDAVLLAADTESALDHALRLQLRDTVRGLLTEESWRGALVRMQNAATSRELTDPANSVVELAKWGGLAEGERESVLAHLIRGGDLTRWGVAQAVTRAAADVDSYDRATEMEALGWQVIDLPESAWREKWAA